MVESTHCHYTERSCGYPRVTFSFSSFYCSSFSSQNPASDFTPLYTTKLISHKPTRDWFPTTSSTISPWIFSLTAHIFPLPYSKFQIFFLLPIDREPHILTLFKRNKEMRKKLDLSFSSPHHSNQTHRPQIANKLAATHKNWKSVFRLSLSPTEWISSSRYSIFPFSLSCFLSFKGLVDFLFLGFFWCWGKNFVDLCVCLCLRLIVVLCLWVDLWWTWLWVCVCVFDRYPCVYGFVSLGLRHQYPCKFCILYVQLALDLN